MQRRAKTITSALLASAVSTETALAQERPGPEVPRPAALEEVVVTARRSTERLQDVPVAVTVMTGQELNARGVAKIEDLNHAVPGLAVIGINVPTTLDLSIRGLGNTNPNTGSDAAVGFYIDEVPINLQNGTNLGFFDIEGVQVLKGPQGTLFGRNTTGGAVLLTTRKPIDRFEAYAQAGGTFFKVGHGVQFEGMANLPVNSRLALRAAVSAQDQDGWVRNVLDRSSPPAVFGAAPLPAGVTDFKNQGGIKSVSWRLSALAKVSDEVETLFVYSGDDADTTALAPNTTALNPSGFIAALAPLLGVPDALAEWRRLQAIKSHYFWSTEMPGKAPLRLNTANISNTTTWTAGDLTVKNIFGYRRVAEKYVQDIVGLPGPYFIYEAHTGGKQFSNELQVQGKAFDGLANWVGGLFFFDEDRHYNVPRQINFGAPGGQIFYRTKARSYSVFGQMTTGLPWVEGLSLTAGGRYTWDRRRATDIRTQPTPTGDACVFPGLSLAQCLLRGSAKFRSPSYTVSLDYKWSPKSLVYVTTRRGYRSGGFSNDPGDAQSFLPFSPEHVTDYEVGLKKDWALGAAALRTNVAAYHSKYDDMQRLVVDPTNLQIQVIKNAGRAEVDGAELEATFVPVPGLEISYAFAYTRPKYKEFIDNGRDFAGATFANAPRRTHNLSVAYTAALPDRYGDLVLRGSYHWESGHFYDDEKQTIEFGPRETFFSPGYEMVNLNATWKSVLGSPVDIEIFVKNLTNAKVAPNGAPLFFSLGNGTTFFGIPPRMTGFNVRYSF